MLVRTAASAALVAMMWGATAASVIVVAPSSASNAKLPAHAIEFGPSLPPVGYVQFCAEQPKACQGRRSSNSLLAAGAETRELLQDINTYVNGKIAPISDNNLYGVAERWTYPVDAGDCEDYALLKQRSLVRLGVDPANLLITVVLDEKREGHAVLTVTTSHGDYVLDNRTNEIKLWNETPYVFLKRQSRQDPNKWIALVKDKVKSKPLTASRR